MDTAFSTCNAMLIDEGKILATGNADSLLKEYDCKEKLDAGGRFIYPGFIDAHAHFVGYANSLLTVNLTGTQSWEEVLQRTQDYARQHPNGWITGRGWDQNDWRTKQFPDNKKLNELFPDRPVLLTRVDGHAAIANRKALELAGLKPGDKTEGGEIETSGGQLTGILIDNAISLVRSKIPPPDESTLLEALRRAEQNCFAEGLTTIDDCGLHYTQVERLKNWQDNGKLKIRLYVMLSDDSSNFAYAQKKGIMKTERMHVRSFKIYSDGALGSRGACLLQPYHDKPGHYGFLLSPASHFDSVARILYEKGWQMCTHAIGDSGNRTILNIYGKYLREKNDRRWRIEHAQVVHPDDFHLFGRFSIIPSVQPTHATSDMYWAGQRLGKKREKFAYAYHDLLKQNGWLPLGTDFPVEDISPLKTFYSAVFRMDAKGYPAGGYQTENALSRKEALYGMTLWAARANFEELEKGSLEKGKWADFVILDKDLMHAPQNEIWQTKVWMTFLGGEKVYSAKQ
ncbi:MAG: amidohydrolase [Chitinophagaceae bacterium]|nr:amidohydrolase [Chitinophagaceae bacterium]